MKNQIIHHLHELEAEMQIKILYAVESGSRAWGFASADSDWDVRFVYVHPPTWYLHIEQRRDCIERMLPNDIDLSGWELQKALRLFRKSNPPLLEWLRSPLIYKETGTTAQAMRNASNLYFSPKSCLYHYFHMAHNNWSAYFKTETARLKKYLYVLRPVLACLWIMRTHTMAPMKFDLLFAAEEMNPALRTSIHHLLALKKNAAELGVAPRIPEIDEYLVNAMEKIKQYLMDFDDQPQIPWQPLNALFQNTLAESWPRPLSIA